MNDITSPYIKLFYNSGVKWHLSIDQDVINKAIKEEKLIFIHLGYFSSIINRDLTSLLLNDEQSVEMLNANFVSVIADREEKPETFLLGLDLLRLEHNFSNGPINIFALPDRRPIMVFSDITPEEFYEITESLTLAFKNKKNLLEKLADELSGALEETGTILFKNQKDSIDENVVEKYFGIWRDLDFGQYMFNKIKPYTLDPNFFYLLKYSETKKDEKIDNLIINYLKHLQFSEAFDPVEGGFFRQCTDFSCTKPLFEKTLTENSRFLMFYANAFKLFKNDSFRYTAQEIFNYIRNNLSIENGGFSNSATLLTTLGDSLYYFYSLQEIKYLFPDNYNEISEILGINPSLDSHLKQLPLHGIESSSRLTTSEKKLLTLRRKEHTGYYVDERIITAFNCDAINSIVLASKYLDSREMFELAKQKMDYIKNQVFEFDKIVCRCLCGKVRKESASLSDYTYYIQALLSFYEITLDESYLEDAVILTETSIKNFYRNENGMFYKSNENENILPFRRESNIDYISPSINSVMTGNLISLYQYTGNEEYLKIAGVQLNNVIPIMMESGQMLLSWGYHLIKYLESKRLMS